MVFTKLTRDIFVIAYEMMREKSWTTLLSPLALAIPAFTLNNYIQRIFLQPPLGGAGFGSAGIPQAYPLDSRATACGGGVYMTVAKAVWNQIQSNDHRLMRRVHRWRAPRWFRILMIVATRGGDGWFWYALAAILLFYGGPHRFAAMGAGVAAAFVGILLFRALKHASRRKRPCEIEPHCWASILPPDKYSFPSGHSITAFAIALSIGLFYPQLQGCLLVIASPNRRLANHSGNAFPERRAGGFGDWRGAGRGQLLYFLGAVSAAPEANPVMQKKGGPFRPSSHRF